MKMDRRGRQYVTWNVLGADEAMTFEVTFDNVTWLPLTTTGVVTRTDPVLGVVVTGLTVRCLVRGPDAPDYSGAILLVIGQNKAKLRVTDNPEILIPDAGTLTVL